MHNKESSVYPVYMCLKKSEEIFALERMICAVRRMKFNFPWNFGVI